MIFSQRTTLATAAALLLLLAGCASPATPETDDGDSLFDESTEPTAVPEEEEAPNPLAAIDACALFTQADAEAMTGIPLQAGIASENPDNPGCTYTSPPEGSTAQAEVGFGEGAKKFYDIDVQLGHVFEDVPGIGDEAFIEPEGGTIFFIKDDMWVSVHIVKLNDALENVEPLKTAASAIAARM